VPRTRLSQIRISLVLANPEQLDGHKRFSDSRSSAVSRGILVPNPVLLSKEINSGVSWALL